VTNDKGQGTDHLEVEVKFWVAEHTAVRQHLLAREATLSKPRVFERNLRLDTPDQQLLQKRQLLRVRQDTAVTITFKSEPVTLSDSEAKVREEIEFQASDLDTAVLLFQRLGYSPVQVYEKYRETFQLGAVEVVLDELPFGNFVELEGPETAIKATAVQLGLDWERRLLTNYLALMAQLQVHHRLPFHDLTFANFARQPYSIADILAW
jgi:adenylate cyclase class 2